MVVSIDAYDDLEARSRVIEFINNRDREIDDIEEIVITPEKSH